VTVEEIADRLAIADLLTRYATALDGRDWPLLDRFFSEDAQGHYGGEVIAGRPALVRMIRSHLDGCGPTQHLLGNYAIELAGDRARSTCSVRALHAGVGAAAGQTYEVVADYHDDLVRERDGWRVARRTMRVRHELGSRTVLGMK
jgi:3-phenylpropionate/cinnamic acid dioxygenase small subunit